jgi:hypothetical protein
MNHDDTTDTKIQYEVDTIRGINEIEYDVSNWVRFEAYCYSR